jgi:hypothetical protein
LVIRGRYGNNVMQGLMSAPDIVGGETSGHGFQAFALSGQKEAEAITDLGLMPVLASCRLRQTLEVGGKALFRWAWRGGRLRGQAISVSCAYDTVALRRSCFSGCGGSRPRFVPPILRYCATM